MVSVDELNSAEAGELILVVPLSSSMAPSGLRVAVPRIAGIDRPSLAICRSVRAVGTARLVRRIGVVQPATMAQIDQALSMVLGLDRGTAE